MPTYHLLAKELREMVAPRGAEHISQDALNGTLRTEFNDNPPQDETAFLARVAQIEGMIATYHSEKEQGPVLARFQKQKALALRALEVGSIARAASAVPGVSSEPYTYSPECQLLWHQTWQWQVQKAAIARKEEREKRKDLQEGDTAEATESQAALLKEHADILCREITQSAGMKWLMGYFVQQMAPTMHALGIPLKECEVRYGKPGSHFYCKSPEKEKGEKNYLLNFDPMKTLLMGQQTWEVMYHELMHFLIDHHWPESVQKSMEALPGTASEPKDIIAFERFRFLKGHWNATADNAVDHGSVQMAALQRQRLAEAGSKNAAEFFDLKPALLTASFALRGFGESYQKRLAEQAMSDEEYFKQVVMPAMLNNLPSVQEIAEGGPASLKNSIDSKKWRRPTREEIIDDIRNDPHKMLQHMHNMALTFVLVEHGFVPDSAEGRESLGLYPDVFDSHPLLPEGTSWQDFATLCKGVMTGYPDLNLAINKVADSKIRWAQGRDALENQRNNYHEQLFTNYLQPCLQVVLDALEKRLDDPQYQPGIPENPPHWPYVSLKRYLDAMTRKRGLSQEEMEELLGSQPGSHAPSQDDGPMLPSDPQTAGDIQEDMINGELDDKSGAPGGQDEKPESKVGGNFKTPLKRFGKGKGRGGNALINLPLGDGRTIEELLQDPLIQEAVQELAVRVEELLEEHTLPMMGPGGNQNTLLPQDGDFITRFDGQRYGDFVQHIYTGRPVKGLEDYHWFKSNTPLKQVPIPGEFVFSVDLSGSMGLGHNSPAAWSLKATALMVLALEQANTSRLAKNFPQIPMHVQLWGNATPTWLGHNEGDEQSEKMIQALDGALAAVFSNKGLPGAHGGTEIKGAEEAFLRQMAADPSPETHADFVGPVLQLTMTDGGVFDAAPSFFQLLYENGPHMIRHCLSAAAPGEVDKTYTDALVAAFEAAEAPEYLRPESFRVPSAAAIIPAMLDWMTTTVEKLQNEMRGGSVFPVSRDELQQEARACLEAIGVDPDKGPGTHRALGQLRGQAKKPGIVS